MGALQGLFTVRVRPPSNAFILMSCLVWNRTGFFVFSVIPWVVTRCNAEGEGERERVPSHGIYIEPGSSQGEGVIRCEIKEDRRRPRASPDQQS